MGRLLLTLRRVFSGRIVSYTVTINSTHHSSALDMNYLFIFAFYFDCCYARSFRTAWSLGKKLRFKVAFRYPGWRTSTGLFSLWSHPTRCCGAVLFHRISLLIHTYIYTTYMNTVQYMTYLKFEQNQPITSWPYIEYSSYRSDKAMWDLNYCIINYDF